MKKSMSLILLVALALLSTARAENQTARMDEVIDNLIESYNAVDSVNYRRHFSPKLLVDIPLEEIGAALRDGASEHGLGKILRDTREISPDGSRAIVLLEFEKNAFDMHLRLNRFGKLTRDTWLPHKSSSDDAKTLSAEDIAAEKKLYGDKASQFAQAFLKRDASLLVPLFPTPEEDPDAPTLEDHQAVVDRYSGKRAFKRVGEITYLGRGDVAIPLLISDTGGYEYTVTFNTAGKIVGLRLTNWAPDESTGKSFADLGEDTLKTSDLVRMSQLAGAFRADSGKVRFIALLSPT